MTDQAPLIEPEIVAGLGAALRISTELYEMLKLVNEGRPISATDLDGRLRDMERDRSVVNLAIGSIRGLLKRGVG